MARYMYQVAYDEDGWGELVQKPVDRIEQIRPIVRKLGGKVEEAGMDDQTILIHSFDLDALQVERTGWGLFRDRRPELYWPILSLDGDPARSRQG